MQNKCLSISEKILNKKVPVPCTNMGDIRTTWIHHSGAVPVFPFRVVPVSYIKPLMYGRNMKTVQMCLKYQKQVALKLWTSYQILHRNIKSTVVRGLQAGNKRFKFSVIDTHISRSQHIPMDSGGPLDKIAEPLTLTKSMTDSLQHQ